MPTCTTYTASSHMTVPLSLAGRPPWRRRRPCTGAPGRNFPLDVGATASSGRRSPKTVLSAHRGGLALSPRGPCNDISDGTGGGSEEGRSPPPSSLGAPNPTPSITPVNRSRYTSTPLTLITVKSGPNV